MRIQAHRALVLLAVLAGCAAQATSEPEDSGPPSTRTASDATHVKLTLRPEALSLATFAGGCFWCMEHPFEKLPGVFAVVSGYTGGKEQAPTYQQVSSGRTGHTEAVQIQFDPNQVSYEQLLHVFWRQIDPTDAGGQFVDRGSQYRPEIFVHDEAQRSAATRSRDELAQSGRYGAKKLATPITTFTTFYPAEDYHQDYYKTNPGHYQRYRKGSGRDRYLQRIWGDEADAPPPPMAVPATQPATTQPAPRSSWVKPSDAELRQRLTRLQYDVTQHEGTERPFANAYHDSKQAGIYVDIVSGEPLFSSTDKFDSGTGWPSFTRPIAGDVLVERVDHKLIYPRRELRSKLADSHLGHVFTDGPPPTGLRYCINSASLRFVPAEQLATEGYPEFAHLFDGAR